MNKLERDILGWGTLVTMLGSGYFVDRYYHNRNNSPIKQEQQVSTQQTEKIQSGSEINTQKPLDKNYQNKNDSIKTIDTLLNDKGLSLHQKQIEKPIYLAIIDHESKGFDPFAISSTGAVGYTQLTVETASELEQNINLYAPDKYFRKLDTGKIEWRDTKIDFRKQYGAELKQLVEGIVAKGDSQSLMSIDKRFDPIFNINAGIDNFQNNINRIKQYVSNENEAYNIAIMAHNRGISAIMGYIIGGKIGNKSIKTITGAITAEKILKYLPHDKNIISSKVDEVRNFYDKVSSLRKGYAKMN